jgi:hypothetical protein
MKMAAKLQLSAGLFALCAFVLVNGLLTVTGGGLFSRFKAVKDQGILFQACNSAIAEYKSTQPDVVLMGSSVLVAPMWSVDAAHDPATSDLYHHHRCYVLEEELSRSLKRSVKVVCMGIPGAMVSDLFLLVDKVLQDRSRSLVLVVALCPRDFMDDLLTGETKTAIFQSLVTPQDLPALGDMYFSSGVEKTDFVLNNILFLYGKRWRYQEKFASFMNRLMNHALSVNSVAQIDMQTRAAKFLQETDRGKVWQQSIDEYKARYNHFNNREFTKQVTFLDSLLKVAAQRKMKVILVNMPLTQDNLALMPPELYENYLRSIQALADRYKVGFIDCERDPYYKIPQGFYDTVHLNGTGGMHFVHTLSDAITSCGLGLVSTR